MSRITILVIVVIITLVGGFYLVTGNQERNDAPATQSHRSYNLSLISPTNNIKPNQESQIIYKITDDIGTTLKNFELDHTKLMHFIAVRSDLQDFQHLHPDFNKKTGEFSVAVTFKKNGKYRLFADFIPGNGQKDPEGNYLPVTTPLDVSVGDLTQFKPQDIVPDVKTVMIEGDYQLKYSLPQTIKVGSPITITINVHKNGQEVVDMEEYLGAQAHGILLKKDTLDFAHLHAMGQEMTHLMEGKMMVMPGPLPKGPEIKFDYTFPKSGIYVLFTQFQHQGKVITTDYVIEVNP